MRRLVLIRHAKSAWDDPLLDDYDRVLNDRGRRAAPLLGAWMATSGYQPDEVILSGARRTVETWEGIAPCLPDPPEARRDKRLYLSSPELMLEVLKSATGQTVAMIAHNPGIAEMAYGLTGGGVAHPRFRDYPTAATAVMEFPTDDWAQVRWRGARLLDFVVPADLART